MALLENELGPSAVGGLSQAMDDEETRMRKERLRQIVEMELGPDFLPNLRAAQVGACKCRDSIDSSASLTVESRAETELFVERH